MVSVRVTHHFLGLVLAILLFHSHISVANLDSQDIADQAELARLHSELASTDKEIAELQANLAKASQLSPIVSNSTPKSSLPLAPVTRSVVPSVTASLSRTLSRPSNSSYSSPLFPEEPGRPCNGSKVGCEEGQLCVEGKCRCPVLYSGPGCRTHIPKDSPCAMGLGHPRFHDEYTEKYRVMRGLSKLEKTSHVRRIREEIRDLTDLVDFSSCAVVGSSSNLKTLSAGEQINAHTAVIRFNDAPTSGYEQWVGNKTSLRIQNLDFCGYTPVNGELCYAYTAADRPCANWKGWRRGKAVSKGKCSPLIPSHRNSKYIFWYWRMNKIPGVKDEACDPKCGAKMSAGYFGLMLALNLCGKVDVYGFGSNSAKEQPHYFTKTFTWDRKSWRARHHWSFERYCMGSYRAGLVDRVKVH